MVTWHQEYLFGLIETRGSCLFHIIIGKNKEVIMNRQRNSQDSSQHGKLAKKTVKQLLQQKNTLDIQKKVNNTKFQYGNQEDLQNTANLIFLKDQKNNILLDKIFAESYDKCKILLEKRQLYIKRRKSGFAKTSELQNYTFSQNLFKKKSISLFKVSESLPPLLKNTSISVNQKYKQKLSCPKTKEGKKIERSSSQQYKTRHSSQFLVKSINNKVTNTKMIIPLKQKQKQKLELSQPSQKMKIKLLGFDESNI